MEIFNKQSARKSAESARARKSRYVFGAAVAGVALSGLSGMVERAHAGLITNAAFTFESITAPGAVFSTTGSITATAGQLFGTYGADVGTGTAYGMHAGTSQYSAPTGNGSPKSFSSNDWAVGDYYEFAVPTSGIQGIQLSFDQISSGTGPSQFNLLYSLDGVSFSTFTSYVVTPTGTASFWSSGTSQAAYNQLFNLSAITGLNNDPSALFILQESANTPVFSPATSGTGTSITSVATSGTDRIDNVVVAGTAVPEPATLSLLTVAAAGLLLRRRSEVEEKKA
jgi:hypothetical protein